MSRLRSLIGSYMKQPEYWLRNVSLRCLRTQTELKTVFIVGAPRSGTTLLHTLVSAHDSCYTVPYETGLFTWQNLYDRPRLGLSLAETHERLNKALDIVQFLQDFAKDLPDYKKESYFVEKTPQHVNRLKTLKKKFPNAKFVHIYRDVRDCYISSRSVESMTAFRDAQFYARYWNRSVANGLKMKSDESVFTLSYEQLVSNPPVELGKLMDFLGLEQQEQQLDPNVYGVDERSKRKHFKRLSGPIDNSSVGRWKRELDSSDLEAIQSESFELLHKLGYEI